MGHLLTIWSNRRKSQNKKTSLFYLKQRCLAFDGSFRPSGAEGSRTLDLLHAMQALSQLSYGPICVNGALT